MVAGFKPVPPSSIFQSQQNPSSQIVLTPLSFTASDIVQYKERRTNRENNFLFIVYIEYDWAVVNSEGP